MPAGRRPLLLSGFGLGAFLDGIVLHQVLQWHHLVSARVPVDDLSALADGLFHLAAWAVVLVGVLSSVRRRHDLPPLRPAVGLLLVGWGAFHVVDQVVLHLLLEAHHVRMVEDYQLYDWDYTAIGVLLMLLGRRLVRAA